MANRRQRRKSEKDRRHAPKPVVLDDRPVGGAVEPLVYSREQAAHLLGVSLATLDRRVLPIIASVKTEWGARLILRAELDRYLAEHTEESRKLHRRSLRPGRPPTVPAAVVARIRDERAGGKSLGEIARRLNHDGVPTAQGGRQWWPSTVRDVLGRSDPSSRAA